MTIMSGFKPLQVIARIAPPPEAINTNGNNFPTTFKSTLPERKNL